jgi:hypothetical protein
MMAGLLRAQAGDLTFGSVSVNTSTGYSSIPVNWSNISYTGNIFAVRI